MVVVPAKTVVRAGEVFAAEVRIENRGTTAQTMTWPSCPGVDLYWRTNEDRVHLILEIPASCPKTIAVKVDIPPGEAFTRNVDLSLNSSADSLAFRLGFALEGRKTLWSDPVKLTILRIDGKWARDIVCNAGRCQSADGGETVGVPLAMELDVDKKGKRVTGKVLEHPLEKSTTYRLEGATTTDGFVFRYTSEAKRTTRDIQCKGSILAGEKVITLMCSDVTAAAAPPAVRQPAMPLRFYHGQ